MLNYYKANYPRPDAETASIAPEAPNVAMPVLMFHGLEDTALLPGALNGTWNWIDADLTLVTIPGASHFVQQGRHGTRVHDDARLAAAAFELRT